MCWNQTVSLNTFLFSLFAILFAYFNNVIKFYEFIYLFSFISMQLVEYFTWKHLDNKKINTILSQIALLLIFIQIPLFIKSRYALKDNVKLSLIKLYILLSIIVILSFNINFSMSKATNGHLAWNWLNFPTIIIIIWLSFILGLIFYEKRYLEFIIYFIIIFGIYYTYYKTNTWGSLWCWIANILALKLILQVFLKDICYK